MESSSPLCGGADETELGTLFKLLVGKRIFELSYSSVKAENRKQDFRSTCTLNTGGRKQNAQYCQMHNVNQPLCCDASDTRMHTVNNVLNLHTATGARKYLDASERSCFITAAAAAPLALRLLCLTLAHTGCRISEALALTPDSLRPSEGVVAFRSLKKRSKFVIVREVPIPDALIRELVIHARTCTSSDDRLWSWGRVRAWQLVKAMMMSAGIRAGPHATIKGLRHAFGLHAIRSGVPLNFVQRWLGHASMSTTAIYLQAVGPDEREIAARMWAGHI